MLKLKNNSFCWEFKIFSIRSKERDKLSLAIHFQKWALRLLEIVVGKNDGNWLDSFALECLGVVNQLNSVNWASLAQQTSLIPWITDNLKASKMAHSHTDQLLQVEFTSGKLSEISREDKDGQNGHRKTAYFFGFEVLVKFFRLLYQ